MCLVPSDCAMLLRSRRTKDGGIMSEMSLSMRVLLVAHNELAIVTKSIAFALSPRRADAVGSLLRGNGGMGATR